MSKVSMVATFTCKEGKNDEMDAALAAQVAVAAELEGVEVYSYHRGEGNNYSYFAMFTSAESIQSHAESEALAAVMAPFMELLESPPQMAMYSPVAASGLEL